MNEEERNKMRLQQERLNDINKGLRSAEPSSEQSVERNAKFIKELAAEFERRQLEAAQEYPIEPIDKDEKVAGHWVFKGEKGEKLLERLTEKPVESMEEPNLVISDGKGNSLGFNVDLPLTFKTYQKSAKKTAIYNQGARVLYPALALAGEVGEVIEAAEGVVPDELLLGMAKHAGKAANQAKKIIRDDDCELTPERIAAIGKELSGCLWYLSATASDLGLSLAGIAQDNLDILADRQERGVIKGDGDNR